MTPKEILEKTHEIIQRGWVQGTFRAGPRHCLYGALCTAEGEAEYRLVTQAGTDAALILKGLLPGETTITLWNDSPNRCKNDVLGLLQQAIDEQES